AGEVVGEGAGGSHRCAEGFFVGSVQQRSKRKIIPRSRARYAPAPIKNPPRQASGVDTQCPALAACEIHERKVSRRRTRKPVLGADRLEIGQSGMIARQQKVVAVI